MKYFILLTQFLLLISCIKKDECFKYELTPAERASIPYNVGSKVVFKNDISGDKDTMEIISKIEYPSFESDMPPECTNTLVRIVSDFDFDKIGSGTMGKRHGITPLILYDYGKEYEFLLSGNLNTVSVNNITYTDVYRTSTDSNRITGSHIPLVPWQIEFSQSQGFLRFYLRNNITWTKVRNL